MSKVERTLSKMINLLEDIGYSTEDAIDMVNNDTDTAKKEIEKWWAWVESRIDGFCEP